jgi:hypothetical protein
MGQERQLVPPSLMTAAPSTVEVASGAGREDADKIERHRALGPQHVG